MIKHHQVYTHNPDTKTYGDCMRTAIACLLDKRPEEVPHFLWDGCDGEEFNRRIDAYLETQGLSLVCIAFTGCSVQETMDILAAGNPNTRFLISGQSERGTNHVVVACNGDVEHDPHPSGVGLCSPLDCGQVHAEFLVPRSIHRRTV